MILKIKQSIAFTMMGLMLVLTGCGGGGSSTPEPAQATTKVAGTASKGIVYPGSVSIYALDLATGVKTAPALATVLTDSKGQYSADLGVYSGPIIIEVTGTYTDEATNNQVLISSALPMRAIVAEVSAANTKRFAVTPLTDLAATLARETLPVTTAKIVAANAKISELFKISDISTVEPVDSKAAIMANATADQRAYTLALAVISQMAKNNSAGAPASFSQIDALQATLKSDLTPTGLGVLFADALKTVIDPDSNPTTQDSVFAGFPDAAATLGSVGTTTLKLTLSAGQTTANNVAINGYIKLPAGTTVRQDSSGLLLSNVFNYIGGGSISYANAIDASDSRGINFQIAVSDGFISGDFATITVDVATGTPMPTDFVLTIISTKSEISGTTTDIVLPITVK